MTGQMSHITVTYNDGSEITRVYAVSENMLRDAQHWAGEQKSPGGKDLMVWLQRKGCQLDNPDGPAAIVRNVNSLTEEHYYCHGKYHRENGPAIVRRYANGSTEETYYRDGKLHREDGPAFVRRYVDGSTVEEYFRDGKMFAPLVAIPGVTVRPPAPKASVKPDARSPA